MRADGLADMVDERMDTTATTSKRTLVIGDCHGHKDRLEALLRQEGILSECPDSGIVRRNFDVEVVQLGDLGHFGSTQAKDRAIWESALKWLDVILWGNHDRAVITDAHFFVGFQKPFPETVDLLKEATRRGQLRLAHEAHGFLLTHAGLHSAYKYNKGPQGNATEIADWLNLLESEGSKDQDFLAIRDAISNTRGGRSPYGGILWRDCSESLYEPVRQVFGHSAKDKVRKYQSKGMGDSFCIDVGQQFNGRLAAIWLPEETVVEVKVDQDQATIDAEREAERRLREHLADPFWAVDGPWRQMVV